MIPSSHPRTLDVWPTVFEDRASAGAVLAALLSHLRDTHPLVLAIPSGGVPAAAEIASALDADFDVLPVRKLGHPGRPSLTVGAVAPDSVRLVDRELCCEGLAVDAIERTATRETAEVERRLGRFRTGLPRLSVAGRPVLVVDDGAATGWTMRAAIQWLRRQGAARVTVAIPAASRDAASRLESDADELVLAQPPEDRPTVDSWYERFEPLSDDEVVRILEETRAARVARRCGSAAPMPEAASHAAHAENRPAPSATVAARARRGRGTGTRRGRSPRTNEAKDEGGPR